MSISEDEETTGDNQRIKLTLKILLIGDSEVGKTSLLLKYIDHIFPEQHIATIGDEYKDKYIIKDNYDIRLQIWDTAGQERFHSISKNIYRNTNGVLFVYDMTKRESFLSIKNWIKDLQNVDDEIKGIIIGNKSDLEEKREIQKEELVDIAKKYEMKYLETSAKNNINVNEGFELIVEEILKDKNQSFLIEKFSRKTKSDLSVESSRTFPNKKKKAGCC